MRCTRGRTWSATCTGSRWARTSCVASLEKKLGRRAWTGEGTASTCSACCARPVTSWATSPSGWVSEEHRTGEVGFVLKPEFTGHGYATEIGSRDAPARLRRARPAPGRRPAGRAQHRVGRGCSSGSACGGRRYLVDNEWVKGEWISELDYALLADEWAGQPVQRLTHRTRRLVPGQVTRALDDLGPAAGHAVGAVPPAAGGIGLPVADHDAHGHGDRGSEPPARAAGRPGR